MKKRAKGRKVHFEVQTLKQEGQYFCTIIDDAEED